MTRRTLVLAVAAAASATAAVVAIAQSAPGGGWSRATGPGADLREPAAVALLADGGIAVAEMSGDTVRVFDPSGTVRWSVGELDHPSGLGADGDGLWVADAGGHRVLRLSAADGSVLQSVALGDDVEPTDIAMSGGALWVSATPQDRLLRVDPESGAVVDVVPNESEPLRAPRGLVSDGNGGLWLAETLAGRVLHLDPTGGVLDVVGEWGLGEGQFVKPKDVALLDGGGLVVLDSHQGVLQVVDLATGAARLVVDGDGAVRFDHPLGLASDGEKLWVADASERSLVELSPGGPAWNGGHFPSAQVLFRKTTVRDDNPGAVCRQCHDGTRRLTAGNWDPATRQHPLEVEADRELPADTVLTASGDLRCTSCHTIHQPEAEESTGDDIVDFGLVTEDRRSAIPAPEICQDCHASYLDTSPSHKRTSHPIGLRPPESADLAAITAAGVRLFDGTLSCMSCHKPHGAVQDHLLVAPADDGTLCVTCHRDHDRDESLHPVRIEVSESEGARVEAAGGVLGPNGDLTCLSCHDPHESSAATLLRLSGGRAAACQACHEDRAGAIDSGGHGALGCADCHGMHEPARLPRGQRVKGVGPQMCIDCHTSTGGRVKEPLSLSATHPLGEPLDKAQGKLPGVAGRVGCTTCHDPHGGDDRLLREKTGELCTTCHPAQDTVIGTEHDAAVVGAGGSTDTCLSCHDVHGTSARKLVATRGKDENPAVGRCLKCHDGSTSAKAVAKTTHPKGLLLTTAGLPFRYSGPVPYQDTQGESTTDRAAGEITCVTCHDPHRWQHGAVVRPGSVEGSEQNSFLRNPEEVAQFCTVCHGIDGLPYFRFFHTDRFRKEEP